MKSLISSRLSLPANQVSAVLNLLDGGATIPFIARYRKEVTGGLNEVDIERIDLENKKLAELVKRKEVIIARLDELNHTDSAFREKIASCFDPKELEDLYLPYKPKRVTRASKAISLGLEPLAKIIMAQRQNDINHQAQRFAKNGLSHEDALHGARDIIAEWVSESAYARNTVRRIYHRSAALTSKVIKKKEGEAIKYKDYFDFSQPLKRIPSHRYLAIARAEKEGFLKVKVIIDIDYALEKLNHQFVKSKGEAANQIKDAVKDSFKRLIAPSIETELRGDAKEKADQEAIAIFSKNLGQLLMASPLGAKKIMALDPGFRTGCKLVCLDEKTNVEHHTTIFPHPPVNKADEAKKKVLDLINKYNIEAIAIGNATAGRETNQFINELLPKHTSVEVYLVSESGASIYSASEIGREEFPDLDLTVRGAISIGRRLIDPLAELVKIDAKSIGVGQYQHDVAQDKLKSSLENTVSFAVNKVGVNLNTASKHLLQHVAGIGPKLAQNIIDHRDQNGRFTSRKELLKVKGLGNKAYEQSAGFLRIKGGSNPLDSSGVHPESYAVVKQMALSLKQNITNIIGEESLTQNIALKDFVTAQFGLPTLSDIIKELDKPGLDPRGAAKPVIFDDTIKTIKDLRANMKLQGKVTNLTKFGAFVDIGIKENGLIHTSQIADRYISDPSEVLSLDQEVTVTILDVDLERKRIQLSMKNV
ncbi:MAG: hypothetical protein ACI9EV_002988 [Urechidicola sp.]